jgi:predicted alpha/beta hydrolase
MELRAAERETAGGPVHAGPKLADRVAPITASPNTGHAITLRAADGQPLAAHWHTACGPKRGAIVLASATGVPQGFYLRFAQWLVGQGVDVLRFDFRGIAASRPPRLRGFVADFSHWVLDLDAALAFALAGSAGSTVSLVGHSIGGFLAPVAPNAAHMHRLVLVGAQSAYWRDFPQPRRWPMAMLWHGVLPVVTQLVGYFPARALRLGEDLPRGVALQWALRPWRDPWSIPAFAAGYARALPPVHLVAAADDAFATPAAIARVASRLSATATQTHTLATGNGTASAKRIGHFGPFRSACAAQVWPRLLDLALPPAPPAPALAPSPAHRPKETA